MKNWKRTALVATILVLSAMTVFASVAMAQAPGPASQGAAGSRAANRFNRGGDGSEPRYGLAVRGAWGGPEQSLLAVAAELFGMEQADLLAELQGGQTLAEVAAANGVVVQDVVDAFLAPRAEYLAQAVADGRITQEDADAMQTHMVEMVTEQMTEPWESRGNGMCDGTCTAQPGQQMHGGQRAGQGMGAHSARHASAGRGMGGRWR